MSILRDVLVICGVGLTISGCWLSYQPAGLIALGISIIAATCWWAGTSVNDRNS